MRFTTFVSLLLLLLALVACGPYEVSPTPQGDLETAAIQSLSIIPTALTVNADSQTGVFVTASIQLGDTLQLGLQSPPAGITATFTSRAATETIRSFLMTLTVSPEVPVGSYNVRVFAQTNGSRLERRIGSLTLTVTQATANPSFKVIPATNALELTRNTNKSLDVFISRTKGFNQAITLSLDTSGTALTGVSAEPINLSSTALSGHLTLAATPTAAPVFQRIQTKIKGVAGSLTKQANLNLTVRMPPGELDPTFAGDGTLDVTNFRAIALQSNDKLITLRRSSGTSIFIVERYKVDGSPDTAFGSGGATTLDLSDFENPSVVGVVVDANNRILMLAQEAGTLLKKMTLFRLRANGRIDTTFGSGTGKITTDLDSAFAARDLVVQPDGKAVVGLTASGFTGSMLLRFLSDGSGLDSTFASQGQLLLSEFGAVLDIALQTDGKMVLAGRKTGGTSAAIARVSSSGVLDNSFDSDGIVEVDLSSFLDETFEEIAVDASNRIVAAGFRGSLLMARVSSSGSPDTSFSGDGVLVTGNTALGFNPDQLRGLVLQDDGKQVFVLTNRNNSESDFLLRQTPSGVFDSSFSGDGKLELGSMIGNDSIDIKILKDSKGRLVVLGTFAIARIAL